MRLSGTLEGFADSFDYNLYATLSCGMETSKMCECRMVVKFL